MNKFLFAAALIVAACSLAVINSPNTPSPNKKLTSRLRNIIIISKRYPAPFGVVDAHIVLTNLTSQIGREEPNKVTLTGDANLDMNSCSVARKATMKPKLKALPVFDKEKGAIFLKDGSGR